MLPGYIPYLLVVALLQLIFMRDLISPECDLVIFFPSRVDLSSIKRSSCRGSNCFKHFTQGTWSNSLKMASCFFFRFSFWHHHGLEGLILQQQKATRYLEWKSKKERKKRHQKGVINQETEHQDNREKALLLQERKWKESGLSCHFCSFSCRPLFLSRNNNKDKRERERESMRAWWSKKSHLKCICIKIQFRVKYSRVFWRQQIQECSLLPCIRGNDLLLKLLKFEFVFDESKILSPPPTCSWMFVWKQHLESQFLSNFLHFKEDAVFLFQFSLLSIRFCLFDGKGIHINSSFFPDPSSSSHSFTLSFVHSFKFKSITTTRGSGSG